MKTRYFTDLPFEFLGDNLNKLAKMREIDIISTDHDKRAQIKVEGIETEIKYGYIYLKPYDSHKYFSRFKLKEI